jgi:hypothetical protein
MGFFSKIGKFLAGSGPSSIQRDPTKQFNRFSGALRNTFENVFARSEANANFNKANALAAALQGDLKTSAILGTTGAQTAALNAARLAGGGGRGLALGGRGAELASRAATQAAVGQQSALTNALLQGRQLQVNTLLNTGGARQALLAQYLGLSGGLGNTGLGGALAVRTKAGSKGYFSTIKDLTSAGANIAKSFAAPGA